MILERIDDRSPFLENVWLSPRTSTVLNAASKILFIVGTISLGFSCGFNAGWRIWPRFEVKVCPSCLHRKEIKFLVAATFFLLSAETIRRLWSRQTRELQIQQAMNFLQDGAP